MKQKTSYEQFSDDMDKGIGYGFLLFFVGIPVFTAWLVWGSPQMGQLENPPQVAPVYSNELFLSE